jgi:hypothetical protein
VFLKVLKSLLLALFIGMLILPHVQKHGAIADEQPLQGVFVRQREPVFSGGAFFSAGYQDSLSSFIREDAGFRNTLIRINNQINFSVFGWYGEKTILVGKKNVLYEDYYVDSYAGRDFIGVEEVRRKVLGLKQLQDSLAAHGVHFLFVIEPSKVWMDPDHLPRHWKVSSPEQSNYLEFTRQLPGSGIHWIDFNKWFLELRDTCPYPLYPLAGIHWSTFVAQHYVTDSLFRWMEQVSCRPIQDYSLTGIEWKDEPVRPDNELAETMNLLWKYPYDPMPYGKYTPGDPEGCFFPRVLTVADSYYWLIYNFDIVKRVFLVNDYWYRMLEFHPAQKYGRVSAGRDAFFRHDLLDHDFVMLMATEVNLYTLFGFVEKANFWMTLKEDPSSVSGLREERVIHFQGIISADSSWQADLRKQARTHGISLERMIRYAAEYMADHEPEKK